MRDPKQKYIPGEVIIFDIRPSFIILIAQLAPIIIVLAGIIFLFSYAGLNNVFLIIGTVVAASIAAFGMFLNWRFTSFRLTNKRVENHYGIVGSREEEISLDDIQTVDVETTLLGAILNFGNVSIKAAGEQREVDFTNIANAKKVSHKIEDMSVGQEIRNRNRDKE